MLQGKSGQTPNELAQGAAQFIEAARKHPAIGTISTTFSARTPNFQLDIDREKAKKLGVPVNDVFQTLQTFMGGYQVNDYTRFGRKYKVTVQSDSSFRREVDDISKLFVRNANGAMLPLDTLVPPADMGARFLQRYNLYPTAEFSGSPAPGTAPGMRSRHSRPRCASCPRIRLRMVRLEPAGDRGGQCGNGRDGALGHRRLPLPRRALRELGGAVRGAARGALRRAGSAPRVLARGLDFNVYGQIGLVTLVGLAAKNAILIVEFAKMYREQGMELGEAAFQAAKLRLRPIIMTSFAFILGVVPLVIAGRRRGIQARRRHHRLRRHARGHAARDPRVPALYVIVQGLAERFGGGPPAARAPPRSNPRSRPRHRHERASPALPPARSLR